MQDEFLRLQSVLRKTIVFITHDFDEAIRLADRIAIMKDGAVIQVDTPERLVLAPADAYVAEFTRHIPRAKVLTVRSEEHTSELQSLMRISYAVFCLKQKKYTKHKTLT